MQEWTVQKFTTLYLLNQLGILVAYIADLYPYIRKLIHPGPTLDAFAVDPGFLPD